MSRVKLFGAACICGFLVCPAVANAITLDFEEGLNYTLGQGPVPVGSYNVNGFQISFSNASYADFSQFASFYPDALSGQVGIVQYVGNFPYLSIVASFNEATTAVSVRVFGSVGSLNYVTSSLTAYGPGGELLATDSYTNDTLLFSALLSVSAQNIASVQFEGSAPSVISAHFDDFSVTPLSAVPLPPSFSLFAAGLGVMGLLGWWKKWKAGRHFLAGSFVSLLFPRRQFFGKQFPLSAGRGGEI